jgi:tetratricopeptide (TPR) repeat protein
MMLSALRDFAGAQQQIEAALKLNPALAEAHDIRGTLLERKGQTAEALAEYKEAVRLQPTLFHAQLNLGAVLQNAGDAVGAAEHLHEAAKSPDPAIRDQAEHLLKSK